MRHEAGHVMAHAYQLHRRRRWQQLFGPSSKRYPRYYRPNPASRHHVQHLRMWYAQSHPDEDFAETFAVWLRPRSHWRSRYAGWPALKKLEYVDELMRDIAGKRPTLTRREKVDPAFRTHPRLLVNIIRKSARFTSSTHRKLTIATCAGCSRKTRNIGIPRPLHRSLGGIGPKYGSWWRSGRANISSRLMSCLRT